MLVFDRPLFVLAAVISPFVFLIVRRFFRSAFSLPFNFGASGGTAFKPPASSRLLSALPALADCLAAGLLLLAAAGPAIARNEAVRVERGADILFVLDCSPSMAALDMDGGSRLDAARALIRDFALARPADAVGLAAAGREAALLVPATVDRGALFTRLDSLEAGELGDGTALGPALALAALHLGKSAANRRALVLITDGENNAGAVHPLAAAEALAGEGGAALYVIGVGSAGAVRVDYADPLTGARRTGGFESRYSADALRAIADAAGGVFLHAPDAASLAAAFGTLNRTEAPAGRSITRTVRHGVHTPLIAAALLLVCLSILL